MGMRMYTCRRTRLDLDLELTLRLRILFRILKHACMRTLHNIYIALAIAIYSYIYVYVSQCVQVPFLVGSKAAKLNIRDICKKCIPHQILILHMIPCEY